MCRVGQLADILVLWAHTSNFSTVQKFGAVESQPLQVFARELGTNIPRNKIFRMYRDGTTSSRLRDKGNPSSSSAAAAAAVASGLVTSNSNAAFTSADDTAGAAPLDLVNGEEKGVAGSTAEDTVVAVAVAIAEYPTVSEEGTETESVAAAALDKKVKGEEEDSTAMTFSSAIVTNNRDPIMDPNEPVYMGTKKYPELFAFWQVSCAFCLFVTFRSPGMFSHFAQSSSCFLMRFFCKSLRVF
jgi:hypothetical protein